MSATASPTGSGLKVLRALKGDERVDTVLAELPGHAVPRVVKVLKPETRVDVERFVEACREVATLESPAVLPVLGYGRMRDGRAYVVTAEPETAPFSEAPSMAMEPVVAAFANAARALAALHASGLTLGGRVTGAELFPGPPARLDVSLAGLSLDGSEPARDVKALVQVLVSFSEAMASQGQFETSVLEVLEPITDAGELANTLEDLQGRWRARTEVSGKHPSAVVYEVEVDLSGTTLGQWQLERVLGEGAMGKVYLGRHARIGREAAVKVLKSEHAKNAESVQRFIQEATAVNAIKNEHIVEISDFGEQPSAGGVATVFCVMELLEGRSLADAMDAEAFTLARAARVAREMALALHAAHQVGVVHRDIKPENIFLLKRDEFVKVLDFGVAKLLKPLGDIPRSGTQAGVVIGTPDYMAPEQALGGAFDFRVDLWAVGVVLYEMLTGRRPFTGDTFGRLVVELTTKPPPPLPHETSRGEPIPAGFSRLVMKCLARMPEDRFQSGEALAQALEPWTRPGGPRDIEESPDDGALDSGSDLPLVAPRSKAPLVLGTLFVLAVVAAGGYLLFAPSSPEPAKPVEVAAGKPPAPEAPKPVEAVKAPEPPPPPPAPTTVWLEVATHPSGATVKQVEGDAVLGKTPLRVELPKRQSLALKLELDGHVPVVREVPFSANVALQIDLEKKPRPRAVVPQPPPESPKVADPKKGPVSNDGTVDPFNP